MSALDDILDVVELEWQEQSIPACRAELAALREADIRTLEHCGDCGSLMVVDYDALEGETENQMYCPVCRCKGLEQANGVWRATVEQQAQRIAALEAALLDVIIQACHEDDGYLDSMALTAYAEAMRLLAAAGKVKITSDVGRRVIAEVVLATRAPEQKEQEA